MNVMRRTDDLFDLVRVLLLVQGAILVATALEALLWGLASGGGALRIPFLISAASAAALLVARARLRPGSRWSPKLIYLVEGFILVSLGIDTALASFITHAAPPAVAILTRLVIPVAILAALRRTEVHA